MREPGARPLVPVLLYHSIGPAGQAPADRWQVAADDLREDLEQVLLSGCTPLTASEYGTWLRDRPTNGGTPVLVTFDDGYADFADTALPLLQSAGIPATLFVTSGALGTPGMLSARAVRDLADAGVEIGSHTVTHPHLDLLPTPAARRELAASRQALESLVSRAVTSVAYPHGSFRRRDRTLAAECGYHCGYAVKNALSHPGDDMFAIARFTVRSDTTRGQVRDVLRGRGAPMAWSREKPRTTIFRCVRWVRHRCGGDR